jgi:transposase
MSTSDNVTIAVKVPIKWEAMTQSSKMRLRQIVGRDTRVIRAFLGVIEQNEHSLLTGKNHVRIHEGELDKLTIVTKQFKPGYSLRTSVPHDFKARFPRISANELNECRRTAVKMYESYLALRKKKGRKASRPLSRNPPSRIPRWILRQRFNLVENETAIARWWLDLRDSFELAQSGLYKYKRIRIPLEISPFHTNQLNLGKLQALQIIKDSSGKWWAALAVRVDTPSTAVQDLPPAVLGIDLGVKKAACTTLVTPRKVSETRYFVQKEKVQNLERYDELVAQLQHETATRMNDGTFHDNVAEKLRRVGSKRENVAREYDRVLIRNLVDYILELSERYTLYVAIGRLKNIRVGAQKATCKSKGFRKLIHSWTFARITEGIVHQLAQLGWNMSGKDSRFRVIPESWTSIMCWKCGSKGVRPRQNLFVCPTCGHQTNADRNGSINIAARLITLTESLHSVKGQGKWDSAIQKARSSRPRSWRRTSSRKSPLSSESPLSGSRESAAVHSAQASLLDFGDGVRQSDHDPAVAKTVEDLSASGGDGPDSMQEKKAWTVGGIWSK